MKRAIFWWSALEYILEISTVDSSDLARCIFIYGGHIYGTYGVYGRETLQLHCFQWVDHGHPRISLGDIIASLTNNVGLIYAETLFD